MSAINLMLTEAIDAIDTLGADIDVINEGYHFKHDPNTRSVDDITIKADGDECVLACIWKNLSGYKPSLPNMRQAFENFGWVTRDREPLRALITDLLFYASNDPNSKEVCDRANKFL